MNEVNEMTEIVKNYEKERDEYVKKAQEATSQKLEKLTEEIIKQLPVIKNVEYHNIASSNNLMGHSYGLHLCRISYKGQSILNLGSVCTYYETQEVVKINMYGYNSNVEFATTDIQELCDKIVETVKARAVRIDREERSYTLEELQRELDALDEFKESFANTKDNECETTYNIIESDFYKLSDEDKIIEIDLHHNDLIKDDRLNQLKEDIKSGISRKEVVGTTNSAKYDIRCRVESYIGGWQEGKVLPSMLKSKIKTILKGAK